MDGHNDVYTVHVHPTVTFTISEHCEFLARVDEAAAKKLWAAFYSDIASLEHLPYRCPVFHCGYLEKDKYRYLLSSKRYRIIYAIIGNDVFVDDVQDCRKNND